ncbi:hypothetical protein ON010_g10794 [Phytophthora cinnamomi]|nr:hypothetical protein ON010_g10794 [Phytophthora cinnamomi]
MVVAFTRSSVAPAKLSAGANGCNERTNQSSSRSQQNPIVLPALIAQPASLWAPHCAFGGAKVPRCKPSEAIISNGRAHVALDDDHHGVGHRHAAGDQPGALGQADRLLPAVGRVHLRGGHVRARVRRRRRRGPLRRQPAPVPDARRRRKARGLSTGPAAAQAPQCSGIQPVAANAHGGEAAQQPEHAAVDPPLHDPAHAANDALHRYHPQPEHSVMRNPSDLLASGIAPRSVAPLPSEDDDDLMFLEYENSCLSPASLTSIVPLELKHRHPNFAMTHNGLRLDDTETGEASEDDEDLKASLSNLAFEADWSSETAHGDQAHALFAAEPITATSSSGSDPMASEPGFRAELVI